MLAAMIPTLIVCMAYPRADRDLINTRRLLPSQFMTSRTEGPGHVRLIREVPPGESIPTACLPPAVTRSNCIHSSIQV